MNTQSENNSLPLEEQLPQNPIACPSDMPDPNPDDDISWWKPGWNDVWKHVGYRWIYLTPATVLMV